MLRIHNIEYFLQHCFTLNGTFKSATYPINHLHVWQPVLDAGLCLGVEPMAFHTPQNIGYIHLSAVLKLRHVPAMTTAQPNEWKYLT